MKVYIPSHNGQRKCIIIVDSAELEPMQDTTDKYVIHSDYYDYIYDGETIFTNIEAVQNFWDGKPIPEDMKFKKLIDGGV